MKISIDCWGTLLKGSPTFSAAKIELVKKYFPGHTDRFITYCFSEAKKTFNDIIENSGGCQPSTDSIFTYLLSKLNMGYSEFPFLKDFISAYQSLALEHPPLPYSETTVPVIRCLSKKHKLIISSNTMFITGDTLQESLDNAMAACFTAYRFSDHMRVAKPHKFMYGASDWHIGDNPVTDSVGAFSAGIKSIIINSNDKTIEDAYNIINQRKYIPA